MSTWNQYTQGMRLGMDQRKNALSQNVEKEKRDRIEELRNILSGAYQPATPALPPEMQEGPVQPTETMPYPAEPGRMDMQAAYGDMFQQGFGLEALKMQAEQQKLAQSRGASTKPFAPVTMVGPGGGTQQSIPFFDPRTGEAGYKPLTLPEGSALAGKTSIEMIEGVPTVVDNHTGRVIRQLSSAEAELIYKAETEKAKKLGVIAGAQIKNALDMIPKISSNIGNLQEVVRLVEREGASTGPLMARLPSFRQSSIELDNMQKQLGLDVIGSVTFGALSKGELDLAMSKALPTHLSGPDLINWAKSKISAQEKLRDYFSEQAQYLSVPGNTPSGWLQRGRTGVAAPDAPTPKNQAEFDALPSGTVYIDPDDNKQYRKP